jgi:general secretion pathway protein C
MTQSRFGVFSLAQIPHQQLRRVSLFVFLVVSAFLVAHSINAFVADALYLLPDPPKKRGGSDSVLPASYSPTQYAEDVRSSGLFLLPPREQGLNTQGEAVGAPVRASLGVAAKIRLIGVVMGDGGGVFAIVEELTSKKQLLYRLHDQIQDLGEVSEIRREGIVVRRGDQGELLDLGSSETPAGAAGGSVAPVSQAPRASVRKVIDRREVEQAMSDLPKLLTQARAVPYMVNGTVNGFRIDYIAPTSFYERIGVRAGDVLQRVNGVDIRDPSAMLSLLQQLKNERVVKLDMVRNNQRSTVTYELR